MGRFEVQPDVCDHARAITTYKIAFAIRSIVRASGGSGVAWLHACHLAEGLPGVMRHSNARQICNRMIRVEAHYFSWIDLR